MLGSLTDTCPWLAATRLLVREAADSQLSLVSWVCICMQLPRLALELAVSVV
jgi:hypothetical protein